MAAEDKALPQVAAEQDEDLAELAAQLTKRQRDFVHELEKDGVASRAAIRAGYSEKAAYAQASRMLKNPKVLRYRHARTTVAYKAMGLGPEQLALDLLEIRNRCMQAVAVMEWDGEKKQWVESGEWRFDAKGATRAIELLGDSIGMFEKRINVPGITEGVEEYLKRVSRSDDGKDEF